MELVYLWKSIRNHFIVFGLVIALCIGAAFLANEMLKPTYRANVSLVANIASKPESSTYNEFLASQMLTKTYEDTMQSRYIASEVKKKIAVPESSTELLQKIKVRTDPGTLVIMLSYTGEDPKQAVAIANAFAESFVSKSKEIIADANVSILDLASMEDTAVPVSPRKNLNLALAAFVGLFAALSLVLILERRGARKKSRRHIPDEYPGLGNTLVQMEEKYKGGVTG